MAKCLDAILARAIESEKITLLHLLACNDSDAMGVFNKKKTKKSSTATLNLYDENLSNYVLNNPTKNHLYAGIIKHGMHILMHLITYS